MPHTRQTGKNPVKTDTKPATLYFTATKHDSTDEARQSTGGMRVGTAGDVVAVRPDNTAVTFKNCSAGEYLPIVARRVNSTGTTAADIVFIVAAE